MGGGDPRSETELDSIDPWVRCWLTDRSDVPETEKSSERPRGEDADVSRMEKKRLGMVRKEGPGSLSFVAKDITDITALPRTSEDDIE